MQIDVDQTDLIRDQVYCSLLLISCVFSSQPFSGNCRLYNFVALNRLCTKKYRVIVQDDLEQWFIQAGLVVLRLLS